MSNRVTFKQADLVRALKAAAKAGLKVQRFEIDPDGRIVVVTGEAAPEERDYLAEWRANRARQKALPKLKGWDDVVDGTWRANGVITLGPKPRGSGRRTNR